MTRIEIAPEVFDDFDHFFDPIAQFDVGSAPERIGEILQAVQIPLTNAQAANFALASRFRLTPCSAAMSAKLRWTSGGMRTRNSPL